MVRTSRSFIAAAVASLALAHAAGAAAQESFFAGKVLRIVVGTTPGGGFDTYSRTIARHMARHIPGSPTIIVENMPGAATLIAANHVYRAAKPDGLTIVNFQGGFVLGQRLGQPGIEFDVRKYEWLGSPSSDNAACAFTAASGITSIEKWMASKTPVKLGGIGRGSSPDDPVKLLKEALGLPVQLVSGYKGTAEIRQAAEGGEVAGSCWEWESMRATWRSSIDSGAVVVVLQATQQPLPDLPKVPLAISYAKSEEGRTLIRDVLQSQVAITRLYALPPGTPRERIQLLRRAFVETLKDPAFLADARKARLEIVPVGGEELEKIVQRIFDLDPALLGRLKEILK